MLEGDLLIFLLFACLPSIYYQESEKKYIVA
jgi:hypothetical protein